MSVKRHHAEWLSLVEVSGPFLTMPVLEKVFPNGLDAHEPDHFAMLRAAYEEWDDNQTGHRPNPAIHTAWVKFILTQTLGLPDEVLAAGQDIPQTLKATVSEHGETLRPDFLIRNPTGADNAGKPRLLVQTYPFEQNLEKPVAGKHWKASPATRMMELLHQLQVNPDSKVRLGLVTNGEHWMLVDAPKDGTTGFASWYAGLWLEEKITLMAFRSLLGVQRFFNVGPGETLEEMLAESATHQQEVTDQLGLQVRRAVEVLIQSLDRSDQDHGRQLLADVPETVLYEAALTVMMRLVFLFSAEERELLLLGDPLYDQYYAVSTLVAQLQEAADQHGEEVLERRLDAWVRLLSTFRAVYGGVQHERMKLPAYSGNLFNPDRFPFLEGRQPGTLWRDTPANPLPVNNRTVLHLLRSLQYLEMQGEARRLSFRALDIEQIGHVYEGLLDHTAKRATEPVLGFVGAKGKEPEIPLAKLGELTTESQRTQRKTHESKELMTYLKEVTGRSESALSKALSSLCVLGDSVVSSSSSLYQRVLPFAGLIRNDTFGKPVVIRTGSVYVTAGTDRRSSGTHYTPRSLTEPIVRYTLEPLVYDGPAAGKPKEEWKLHSAKELLNLKICDMACGSGAFLVQACRYLSERLLEAWENEARNETNHRVTENTENTEAFNSNSSSVSSVPLWFKSDNEDERITLSRRLVVQRCLYGVDKNPLAAEMAKLSLWLLTLAKDRPFTFLDHAIRCGDSLVGIHDLKQLENLTLTGAEQYGRVWLESLQTSIRQAKELRQKLETMSANDAQAVAEQEALHKDAERLTAKLRAVADLLIADAINGEDRGVVLVAARFRESTAEAMQADANKLLKGQRTFHWPLEYPEVFIERGGFDAFVGNPPFMGGSKIVAANGMAYREFLVNSIAGGNRGNADICAYFFLRAWTLVGIHGVCGLLATKSVAQGDAREVGLAQIEVENGTIFRAIASRSWPGTASLEVAHVWLRRSGWRGCVFLDDSPVTGISSFLAAKDTVFAAPFRLHFNSGLCATGNKVYGKGFVLNEAAALALLEKDTRNREVVLPWIIGEDLNSRLDQTASRWVINFGERAAEEAATFHDCFDIVQRLVKPYRMTVNRTHTRERWWLHEHTRQEFYDQISDTEQIVAIALTSKTLSPALISSKQVIDQSVVAFASDSICLFTMLASSLHYWWVIQYGTPMRTDARYSISNCFETFPFPSPFWSSPGVPACSSTMAFGHAGESYQDYRKCVMLTRKEGLTKTYNRFHKPDETSTDIQQLRQLHVEMDHAVAAAYGWTDLDLGHGFHDTKQGVRFTIREAARREVLGRLLQLNHERYAAEVEQGLHDQKKPRNKPRNTRKTRKKTDEGGGLFE